MTDPTAALDLPPIDQVSYMVADLDEAVARFDPLFGPFSTLEAGNEGSIYRGEAHDVHLKVAFGRSGDTEIELIQYVSGESPHKEWIERHGESICHVRFKVDDVDTKLAELAELGYETVWYNASLAEHGIKYAYVEAPAGGHLLELVQGL